MWSVTNSDSAHEDRKQIERRAKIINEINYEYCDRELLVFNRSNENFPLLCKDKPYVANSETPATFLDFGYMSLLERYVFDESNEYWVSSTTTIPDFRETIPLILSRNYYAKLVLPIASLWAASGLHIIWNKVQEQVYAVAWNSERQILLYTDKGSESSRVIQFTSLALYTQIAVITLYGIFLCVALPAFIAEWLSGSSIIFCVLANKKSPVLEKENAKHLAKDVEEVKSQRTHKRTSKVRKKNIRSGTVTFIYRQKLRRRRKHKEVNRVSYFILVPIYGHSRRKRFIVEKDGNFYHQEFKSKR